MHDRLGALRTRLLLAMLAAACAGLGASYLLISRIQDRDEQVADRAKALRTARAVAADMRAGALLDDVRAIQRTLPDDRLVVRRRGAIVFDGPPNPRPLELSVTARFPGGSVTLEDHESRSGSSGISLRQLMLILAGVAALVIAAAVATTTLVVRGVRRPVARATAAARRVAAGDLSARMGPMGEQEFAELARTFDTMAARLEAADRDQRRFLADVAHEIATPTNAISGFAGALADGTISGERERAEAMALIAGQQQRLASLIADLRELTTLELAESVRVETVDVGELCADIAARHAPDAERAAVELRATPPPAGLRTLRADRRLLETVLDNLVSNAIRYTPAGGRVELAARKRGDEVVLSVADTGIGIAPEHQERIFDRLYRVDAARARASGGSGLGLAIARRAAQALAARIELESEPGAGSEFRLVLPAAAGQAGEEPTGEEPAGEAPPPPAHAPRGA